MRTLVTGTFVLAKDICRADGCRIAEGASMNGIDAAMRGLQSLPGATKRRGV